MIEGEEECELQQLVPSEEEHNFLSERCGEITPPVTPTVSRLNQKSSVYLNNKVCNHYILALPSRSWPIYFWPIYE